MPKRPEKGEAMTGEYGTEGASMSIPVKVGNASVRECVMYANLLLRGEDTNQIGTRLTVEISEAYDDWLAQVRAEAAAEALTKLATHLDGGTPRAWGFHHPCDPPGKRWEPDEADRALMTAADIAREQAARALADKEQP